MQTDERKSAIIIETKGAFNPLPNIGKIKWIKRKLNMAQKKEKRQLYRAFMLVTYEGSENLDTEQLWGLCSGKALRLYRSPLHDSDLWKKSDEEVNPEHKEGSPKKEHTHLVLYFENARTVSGVAKELGLNPTQVVGWNDERKAVRYLAHADDKSKHQYDWHDIVTETEEAEQKKRQYFEGKTKEEVDDSKQEEALYVMELVEWRTEHKVTYKDLLRKAVSDGKYDVLRRNFSIINEISKEEHIQEHIAIRAVQNISECIQGIAKTEYDRTIGKTEFYQSICLDMIDIEKRTIEGVLNERNYNENKLHID